MQRSPIRAALLSSAALAAATSVAAQNADQPFELDTIYVESTDGVATEGTGSYATGLATVGGRQPVAIRHVPQSVTVVTEQRLADANAKTLEEATYVLPSLNVALGDVYAGSLYMRGHEVFTYNIDGTPRPFLSVYGTTPDLVFFDRVELLSGPSGVYQGTGEPVGTINLVRKRPTDTPQGRASASVGSFDSYRGEVDYSTPLNASGTIRGRIIGYIDARESYVDFAEGERRGVSGTVDVDVSDQTTLSFGVLVEDWNAVRFSGLPTFADGSLLDVSRETFVGADWNNFDSNSQDYFFEAEHQFDYGGVLKFTGRSYGREVSIKSLLPSTPVDRLTGDFDTLTFAREFEEDTEFVDLNLTSPFVAFGSSGEFTAGIDYRSTEQVTLQNFDFSAGTQNINTFDPTSITEPAIDFPGVGPGFRLNTDVDTREIGAYLQARVNLGARAKLSVGTRYVSYDSKSVDTDRDAVRSDIEEDRFSSTVGLTFDITDNLTAYGSYSDIFQPQAEQRADGAQLNPVIGRQYEIGLKGEFNGGQLTTQTAIFRIDDENRAIEDPDTPGAFLPGGRSRTDGFELLVQGQIAENWSIAGGYTYVDTDRLDDPTSPHNLVLSGGYTVPQGRFAGTDLGLGIRAASGFESTSGDGTIIRAGGYIVADAMIRYPITDAVAAQLSVENIFDRTYYTRVNQTSRGNFYGSPRRITLALSANF